MEDVVQLGIQFYGSYAISMLILVAWVVHLIRKEQKAEEKTSEMLAKLTEVIQSVKTILDIKL